MRVSPSALILALLLALPLGPAACEGDDAGAGADATGDAMMDDDMMAHDMMATDVAMDLAREAMTDGGAWQVSYVPGTDPVPLDAFFALDVMVMRASDMAPATDEVVAVDARMPAHGHGMNVNPTVTRMGDGMWKAEGMFLHMPGHWEIVVTVTADGATEEAVFNVMAGT